MPRVTGIVKRTRKKKAKRKPPAAFPDSTKEDVAEQSPPTRLNGHSSLSRAMDYKTRNLEEQNKQLQDRIDFLEARVRNNTKSALKMENAELVKRNEMLEQQLQGLVSEYESERAALVKELDEVRNFHQDNQFEVRLENCIDRENAAITLCLQMKGAIKHNTARAESKKLYGLLRGIMERREEEEPDCIELKAPPRVERQPEPLVLEPKEPEFRFRRGDHVHVYWKKRKTWMEDGVVMNCDWENGRVYVQYNGGMKTRWMLEQSKFLRFPHEAPAKPPPKPPTPSPSPSPEPEEPYTGPYPEGTQIRVYEKHRKQWHKDGLVEDTRMDAKGRGMIYVTFGGGMKFNWFKDTSKWVMKEKDWKEKYGKEDDVALYMHHVEATKRMVSQGPKSVREEYYERIKQIFKKWHKESVPHVDQFLDQHPGQEHELYLQLCTKFNLFPQEQYFGPEDDFDPI